MTYNSGPMYSVENNPDLVAEAVAALRAFHVEDRDTARLLLRLWRRRLELTDGQVEEILDRYPVVDFDIEDVITVRRSGVGGGINT